MTRKLPPDPDTMNVSRAGWAGAALSTFMRETGTDEEDALGDLLTDLMHWVTATITTSRRRSDRAQGITKPRRPGNGPLDLRCRRGLPPGSGDNNHFI